MEDLITKDNTCYGAVVRKKDGTLETIQADCTVLATGGIGGIYRHSTNFRHLTGDALAIAIRHGIELQDINYVQIHPTTFYSKDDKTRSFLISESVRGEGAKLYGKNMERFANELLPRDLLSPENSRTDGKGTEQNTYGKTCDRFHTTCWKNPLPRNIVEHCREAGYDVFKECIPVVPAQHYFMGGIKVDHESRTTMNQLYAVGETACNGVHGKNRLASNSLLESLVFSKRAAQDLVEHYSEFKGNDEVVTNTDLKKYEDRETMEKENIRLVAAAIEKANGGTPMNSEYRHV